MKIKEEGVVLITRAGITITAFSFDCEEEPSLDAEGASEKAKVVAMAWALGQLVNAIEVE